MESYVPPDIVRQLESHDEDPLVEFPRTIEMHPRQNETRAAETAGDCDESMRLTDHRARASRVLY